MAGYENTGYDTPSNPPIAASDPFRQPPPVRPRRQPVDPQMVDKVSRDVNSIGANLRILEERYSLMRNKTQVTEEGMIDLQRSLAKDFKSLNDEITDLKHALKEIVDNLRLIDGEMKNLSKKEELKVLDRYLDFWQPINFVTRDELDRLVAQKNAQKTDKQ